MYSLTGRERRRGLGEGTHGADDRREAAGLHTACQIGEAGAVGLDDEEDGLADLWLSRGGGGDGDDPASGSQDAEGLFEDLAADHVEDDIDLAAVLESVGLQVHELVRSERQHLIPILGPARPDHSGARLESELDGDGADAAARSVDEHGPVSYTHLTLPTISSV